MSALAFVALVICVLGLFLTGSLFGRGPVSIAIQVASAILMIRARIEFSARSFHAANPTEGGLVTSGPYRYIRHSTYAAIFYFAWRELLRTFR